VTPAQECQSHLRELRLWLESHQPKPYWTPQQHQARKDRQRELARWQAKAQLIARAEGGAR
jgi:hypothetical protein